MTGCDLRYLAVELADRTRATLTERSDAAERIRAEIASLADSFDPIPYLADLTFRLRQFAGLVLEQSNGLRQDANTVHHDLLDVIENIRSHFHEAVDERVAAEVQDGEYYSSDDVDEKVREAVEEAVETLKGNLESDVQRAIRDADWE